MAHIVITAINTLRNRGVEALLLSILDGVNRTLDAPKITLLTRDPDGARDSLAGYDIDIVPDSAYSPYVDAPAFDKKKFLAKRFIRMKLLGKLTPAEKALKSADLVIVSGGDTFSSDYKIMERYLRQYDQPVGQGTPLFFVAQSIGPFKTQAEIDSFMGIARHANFTVRETISYKYLTEELGLSKDRVGLTADPAFHLYFDDAMKADMLNRYGLEPKSYAAAAFSRGISGFKGIGHEGHLAACVESAKYMIEQCGKLVLVPHVQLPQGDEDDLSLALEIKSVLNDPRCIVMEELHTSREFKAVLSQAEFVVAERTHGAIGAMSSGVPTLSVGYSIKAEGVLRELIHDPDLFKLSLLPVDQFTADNARAVTQAAFERRAEFAAALQETLPAIRDRSANNFKKVAEILGKG